jgi:hypothetical protein
MAALGRRELLVGTAALVAATATGCRGSDEASDANDRERQDMTSSTTTSADPATLAENAFLAGFPLVTTVRTMQTFAGLIGVNRLFVTPGLVDPASRLVVAPNRDTVYALAVLDLRAGPQVLSLPEIGDRYHVVQLLDAWMGGFGLLGTRATGGRAGSWAVVPPGYDGPVPGGADRLECPTNQAFLLGRIRAVDDADAAEAVAIGRRWRLRALGDDASGRTPDMPRPPGTPQTVGSNGAAFFDELGDALAVNPPVTDEQRAAIDAAAPLGIGPGGHPARENGGEGDDRRALERGVEAGMDDLQDRDGVPTRNVNGWAVNLDLGTPETDRGLKERAIVARYFWGPVPAEEAVYPRATGDRDGHPLDGRDGQRYRIHFAPGGLPPVEAFWSLTVYGQDMFLVPNEAGRYSLSGDTPGLVRNDDGSLDVYLQHDPPPTNEANWLPVPAGPFTVIMRLYLPGEPVLDGTYDYPPITVVG